MLIIFIKILDVWSQTSIILSRQLEAEFICSQVFDVVLLFFFFPERKVLFKKFNDGFGISESLLIYIVNLFECIGKSSLSKLYSLLFVVHNFIVEHREVKSKSKSNWIAWVQSRGGILSQLVVFKGTIFTFIKLFFWSTFGNVSVIVTNHFLEESFGLIGCCNFQAFSTYNINDWIALCG